MATKEKPPFGRDKGRAAAIDFAAAQELVLFARYSDSPELVRPEDRPGNDAVEGLVASERHGAAMLFRYAQGHVGWSEVESSLRLVGIHRAGMRRRLDSTLGAGWRGEWIGPDIAVRLREFGLLEA